MTDEEAKALARSLVERALRARTDATIDRVYAVPDRMLYRVAVVVHGREFQVGFTFEELTERLDQASQKTRIFVTDRLPRKKR